MLPQILAIWETFHGTSLIRTFTAVRGLPKSSFCFTLEGTLGLLLYLS